MAHLGLTGERYISHRAAGFGKDSSPGRLDRRPEHEPPQPTTTLNYDEDRQRFSSRSVTTHFARTRSDPDPGAILE
ncbi:hypothetical protein E2C01_092789 [Portunus trituberculatus]|uniref:Uncharacterized protein n=1 Tax=Portunus trituberculatus TaxID=210409 RepID=A0A5B7JN08_PORTR|nr:hypothetical protein [Portunus trituberculatus]